MKTSAAMITTIVFVFVLIIAAWPGMTVGSDSESSEVQDVSRPRIDFIKTADFYLRDGRFVTGKLIDEDKSKIIIEQRSGNAVEVITYTKKEVDTRTVNISTVPEHKFYEELGDYFAGRTWDFRDDADDFIQAVRAYEAAKKAAERSERRQEDIDELQVKIDKLLGDKQIWTEQIHDRAELKKLEFQATFDERAKDIENRLDENVKLFDETLRRFDAFANQTKKNFEGVQNNISRLNKDISRRMQVLEQRIEDNRQLIDDVSRYRYYRYRY